MAVSVVAIRHGYSSFTQRGGWAAAT